MKILDKLERQSKEDFFLWAEFGAGPDYSICHSAFGDNLLEALPALIRVARAAEALEKATKEESGQAIMMAYLFKTLEELRKLGETE